jgi:hypothetical protein
MENAIVLRDLEENTAKKKLVLTTALGVELVKTTNASVKRISSVLIVQ